MASPQSVSQCIRGAAGNGASAQELTEITKRLAPRWFVMRDVHAETNMVLLQPRWAMSFLRGPMTGSEVRRATCVGYFAAPVDASHGLAEDALSTTSPNQRKGVRFW